MRTVWRITTARFAAAAFSDEGARLHGGRWNPKGHGVIYTAESQSLALLERLVQDALLRARYALIPAQLPADLAVRQVDAAALPTDWRTPPGLRPYRHRRAEGAGCGCAVAAESGRR